jgi:hypothetical protein
MPNIYVNLQSTHHPFGVSKSSLGFLSGEAANLGVLVSSGNGVGGDRREYGFTFAGMADELEAFCGKISLTEGEHWNTSGGTGGIRRKGSCREVSGGEGVG